MPKIFRHCKFAGGSTMEDHHENWGVHLDAARIAAMRGCGAWHGQILTDFFDLNATAHPDATAVVTSIGDTGEITTTSYGELALAADRIALGLHTIGIRRGDIVSFQLPNCWQFLAIVLACIRIGAITHPVMPILRHRELIF